jgi:hypothetical protein
LEREEAHLARELVRLGVGEGEVRAGEGGGGGGEERTKSQLARRRFLRLALDLKGGGA